MRNNGSDLSRFEKLPPFCDFVGSMYRVFYVDRNLLTKKHTGTWKHRETKNITSYRTEFGSQPERTQSQRPLCRGKRILLF